MGEPEVTEPGDASKPAPEPYSHLTVAQYRSLILRQTEAPFSSSLPLLLPQDHDQATPDRQKTDPSTNGVELTLPPTTPSYACANCSAPLFPADAKFASGTGWPSFSSAIPGAIKTKTDWRLKEDGRWVLGGSLGLKFREEVICGGCGGHLGHVFRGEKWVGVKEQVEGKGVTRYCVNGCSLVAVSGGLTGLAAHN
ncbi:hypothetical protein TWF481_003558 [Arthrobotrys musiformis]|uniref:MsrB domain-containing protein n=1 Tax=Arthrobotrys musiformis TaxID=47236 RepID=A0AAV9WGZ1_9PEZI